MSTESSILIERTSPWANNHFQQRRKVVNGVMLSIAGLFTLLALIPLFWIVGYVIIKGGQYITLDFFTQLPKPMGMEGGGVLHAIEGTLILSLLGGIIAIPPGILAAIYAAYHGNTPLGVVIRFSTDVLAGVPSIVIGLFGYALIVKPQGHYSALAGGIALAMIMLPTIIRTTEEMLKLVPNSLRETAIGLGAPMWRTTLDILLPAAGNGIITGILLGLARAAGETAPLLFTALGNENYEFGRIISSGVASHQGFFAILNRIFEQPVDSLPLTLWKYAQQPFPERVNQSWAAALVLMLIVLFTNILTRVWVQIQQKRMGGS
ncbi:MAG: phosphate ABC transporter permease PstA [Anaerolineaceae bacterium]|nr:phosphate ABC transporter permease PstA [Anaerolineaceae bacterium]